jgi:hypothetical protein
VQKGTREVNGTGLLFDVEDPVLARPARPVPTPVVSGSEADLTPVAVDRTTDSDTVRRPPIDCWLQRAPKPYRLTTVKRVGRPDVSW